MGHKTKKMTKKNQKCKQNVENGKDGDDEEKWEEIK